MSDPHGGYGLPTAGDRLNALRTPPPGAAVPPPSASKKLRPELLVLGGVCIVLLMVGITYIRVSHKIPVPSVEQQLSQQITDKLEKETGMTSEVPSALDGDVLFGISLKPGNYPTEMKVGDIVRVVATPIVSGSGEAHEIDGRMTVMSINSNSEFGGETIVTLSGPQAATMAIADSGPLHLTILESSNK